MDVNSIAALFSGLKSAHELLTAMEHTREFVQNGTQLSQLTRSLLDAQAAAMALQLEQHSLTARIQELEDQLKSKIKWEEQAADYKLTQLPPLGVYAYELQGDNAAGKPRHYICAHCYEDERKSILQPRSRGFTRYLFCNACGFESFVGSNTAVSGSSGSML